MDRFAITLMNTLSDDSVTESGQPEVGIGAKMNAFKMAQDWLVKRRKLKPDEGDAEGEGVTLLRELMNSPEKLSQHLEGMGFVKAPPKRTRAGRPPKAETEQRRKVQAALDHRKDQQAGGGWKSLGLEVEN